MVDVVDWDSAGGRAVYADVLARASVATSAIGMTHEAAIAYALQCAFAGEKLLWAAGLVACPNVEMAAQSAADGALVATSGGGASMFGGNAGVAKDALAGADMANLSPKQKAALIYLANARALRELVQTSRPWPATALPDISLAVPSGGEAFADALDVIVGDDEGDDDGMGAIGILILVGVLGSAAIAAAAWYFHDTKIEMQRQATTLDLEKLRISSQAKLAADLAAQQLAAGLPVNVPDLVRSLGSTERAEMRFAPVIAAVIGAAAGAAAAWFAFKRKGQPKTLDVDSTLRSQA